MAEVRIYQRAVHRPYPLLTVTFTAVDEDDEDIEVGVLAGEVMGYDPRLRIAIIRRRLHDPSAPPPGKVVGWGVGWRYQAIVTNRDWEPLDVWRFYNDRGDAERVFKTGKQALGLAWLVSHDLRANTVAFLLRLLKAGHSENHRTYARCDRQTKSEKMEGGERVSPFRARTI